jgi:hypothetical protein
MAIPGIEQRSVLKSMETFGAKVMPQLAKRFGNMAGIGAPARHVAVA